MDTNSRDKCECDDSITRRVLPIKEAFVGQIVISSQHIFTKNSQPNNPRYIIMKVLIISMLFALASASGPACEVMMAIGGAAESVQVCGAPEPEQVRIVHLEVA